MKVIGMIGGMSWESSLEYYRIVNEEVKKRLGGLHSAKVLMLSVDFYEIEELQSSGNWQESARILIKAARDLEKGGAEFVLICTNTMHKVAPEVQASIKIPLIHIADAVGEEINKQNLYKVGLLGTKFTMEQDFLKGHLVDKFNLDVIIPGADSRQIVHEVIYNELCLGSIRKESKQSYCEIIEEMAKSGAQGVILGCTEISLLVQSADVSLPLFDTTAIHCRKAVDFSLNGN